ncbi:MAG: hypothetical protein D6815_04840, partial [Candidatus Dadabacteria bacterium]
IAAGVVNQATIFYNPRLIGADGVPLVGPLGIDDPRRAIRAETRQIATCGGDLVWVGRFK